MCRLTIVRMKDMAGMEGGLGAEGCFGSADKVPNTVNNNNPKVSLRNTTSLIAFLDRPAA